MLTGKYISVASIIERVYRDNKYTIQLDWTDVVEWVFDIIGLIGIGNTFIDKVECVDILEYRGELPCDLVDIHTGGIRDWTTKTPLIHSTNVYNHALSVEDSTTANITPDTTVTINDSGTIRQEYDVDLRTGLPIVPHDADYFRGAKAYQAYGNINQSQYMLDMFAYTLNDNYIFTSFKEGKVEIAYKAYPIDEQGMPKIPDEQNFIEVVTSYIKYKIDHVLWRSGSLQDKFYEKSYQDYCWYAGTAKCKAMVPSLDMMESMKNAWLKLVPSLQEHANGFKYLSFPEQRYNR